LRKYKDPQMKLRSTTLLLAAVAAPAAAQTSAEAPGEIVVTATLKAYAPQADLATRTGIPARAPVPAAFGLR
jgi:hypothetical protein